MRFVVGRQGLEPFDTEAREFLEGLETGEPIEMLPEYPRDMSEHRFIMGCIHDLATGLGTSFDKVRAQLLFETGHFQLLNDPINGLPVIAVNSMSRHAMKDHELHEFWHEAKEVIRAKLLDRISDSAKRDHLADKLLLQGTD